MQDLQSVIKTIQLSEKASLLGELNNQYVFKVDRRANKFEIRRAVEQAFGTKVASVNTCNYAGKKKRQGRASFGRTAQWKKAIVKLAEGESIDLV